MKYNKSTLMSALLLALVVAPNPFTTLSAAERESVVEHRRDRDINAVGRGRRNLGEEKIGKYFAREYRFRADGYSCKQACS